jgi:Asp-tRNA(Asn)/Glu-tRNA(Gln) amidotransferase A subunit family amidase
LRTSATLDTLGLFARCVEDLLLIDAVLSPAKDTREPAQSTADFALRLYRGPHWSRADAATQTAVEAFFAAACPLASSVGETDTPPSVLELSKAQETVHAVEVSQELGNFADANPGGLSTAFLTMVAEGRALAGAAYRESMQAIERARTELDSWLHEGEVLITPAAIGCAPQGLHSTGDPLFCRDWTALGLPAVCLPLPRVAGQLPLGVQLVARPGSDRWLLRVVQQLSQRLTDSRNPATV